MKRFQRAIPSSLQSRSHAGLSILFALGAAVACGSGGPVDDPGKDANADGVLDTLSGPFLDTNNDGRVDSIDRNGDGQPEGQLIDTDSDGIFDDVDLDGDGSGDGSGGAPPQGSGGNGNSSSAGGTVGNSGGSSSGGGPAEGSGGSAPGDCQFTITGTPAELMPTVGVVEFSVTGLPGAVSEGKIEFGLTTEYGMEAPLDPAAPMYKTLLIGMKKQKMYNYRVTVSSGGTSCTSDNQTITTGNLRSGINELSSKSVTGSVGKGFFVVAAKSTALIFDQDGDVVWGYAFSAGGVGGTAGIFSAKMSFDGKYMLARDLGQFDAGNQGKFFRVAMDGSDLTDFDVPGGDHHDFTIIPTGFAYIAKEAAGEFDKIFTVKDDGTGSQVFADLQPLVAAYPQAAGGSTEKSHVNAIHHWRDRDIYTVSNRESDVVGVIDSQGQVIQAFGKQATASFPTVLAEGAGSTWRVQHGHDLYAEDKLLVFSNGNFMGGTSRVLHYTISGSSATLDWEYSGAGNTPTQGDVQMMPDGNIAITSAAAGNIHVINPQQQLQASYSNGNQGFGYATFRSSLYGEPPDGR
ncbi:MAG TPA: aryl-sulfate sulfotransferase [Polyangiaceae bacterium]|nr:aryl-sulfate sulfotransferase [Polyangiaceae bacterium]